MIIDLLSPFWGSLIIGILLMIILGTYHYVRTLVTLNVTNKQLSNVLSELYSLQKNHKEEITDIKKRNKEEMEKILNLYTNKIDEILKHNKPPRYTFTVREIKTK
mgnify:CR=1